MRFFRASRHASASRCPICLDSTAPSPWTAGLPAISGGSRAAPILMGNGFGGTLALAFALAHGDRVGRLVLCDVAPGFPDAGRQAFRIMAATAAEGGMGAIAEIAAKRVFHTVHLGKYPQAIE